MELIPGVAATEDKEVLEQIAYQTVQYFPLESDNYKDCKSLESILNKAMTDTEFLKSDDGPTYIESLKSIIGPEGSYPELAAAKIGNKSWTSECGGAEITGFQACTFELDGKVSVCFRGTPGGSWLDNGYAMAGVENDHCGEYKDTGVIVSDMQKEALDYMQYLTEQYPGEQFYLSGHSKGGNEAQLAALMFADRVAATYNFDGQGFPPDVVAQLQNLPGWKEGREKIYAIHADNDYVHRLGNTITLDENTVYLYTPEIGTIPYPWSDDQIFVQNHYITACLTPDGRLQRQTVEGPLALAVRDVSDIIMSIEDDDVRYNICMAVMAKLQTVMGGGTPPVGGEDTEKVFNNAINALTSKAKEEYSEEINQIIALLGLMAATKSGRRTLGTMALSLLAMGLNTELGRYIISGDSELDRQLSKHDFENEQQIAAYLEEHSENGKLEYLVRGALLRCRYGSHARQLNLRKCHGVYIGHHPCMHALNCVTGEGENDNITFFGVCNAPHHPDTGIVNLPIDVPRDPKTGAKLAEASGGIVTGHECKPVIVGRAWLDTYDETRIVDNGDLDPVDREKAMGRTLPPEAESWEPQQIAEYLTPKGLPSITNLSFLICSCGGLIEPYNSGQQYNGDPEEIEYALENLMVFHTPEENTMHEFGGEGDIHGEKQKAPSHVLNGEPLSTAANRTVNNMMETSADGKMVRYDWDSIELLMKSPAGLDLDKYQALCCVFNSMESPQDIERLINIGYTAGPIPEVPKPSGSLNPMQAYAYFNGQNQQRADAQGYRVCKPGGVLDGMSQWYQHESEAGALAEEYKRQAEIMKAIRTAGNDVYVSVNESEAPVKVEQDGFGYVIRFPGKGKNEDPTLVHIEGEDTSWYTKVP